MMTTASRGPSPRGRGNPSPGSPGSAARRTIPAWAGEPYPPPRRPCLILGPSPRGRGNLRVIHCPTHRTGTIPAWAGEPAENRVADFLGGDHPRVGGGTATAAGERLVDRGPSPRGRGNLTRRSAANPLERTIPAWAGEPGRAREGRGLERDHPRVGGGTGVTRPHLGLPQGPSPRGRGNPSSPSRARRGSGTIPAWAGEPAMPTCRIRTGTDHPRVGGGTMQLARYGPGGWGPSPRGRGNLSRIGVDRLARGTIPAWAGEPDEDVFVGRAFGDHPRVGGGTATWLA